MNYVSLQIFMTCVLSSNANPNYTIIIYQLFRETKKIISKIGNQRYFKVKPQPVGFTVIKKINYNQANETV